jgi:hypothetical protein
LARARRLGLVTAVDVPPPSAIGKPVGLPQNSPVGHAFGIANIVGEETVTLQNPWNRAKPAGSTAPRNYWSSFDLTTTQLYDNGRFLVIERSNK